MSGIKGIQDPALKSLLEQMLADQQKLEARIAELEVLRQPPGNYLFKPFGEEEVEIGPEALIWPVPKDVDGLVLEIAEAGLISPGSGNTEISLYNITRDEWLLYTHIFINSGDYHSDDSVPHVEIDHTFNKVFWRDRIAINVEDSASGAAGLSVTLGFA